MYLTFGKLFLSLNKHQDFYKEIFWCCKELFFMVINVQQSLGLKRFPKKNQKDL